jgi:peptide deformylase
VILPIVQEGDPILRQVAKPVRKFNRALRKLMDDMLETMYDAPGVGLAAPQIGISRRIVVADVGEGAGPYFLVNPEITERSGTQEGYEGCLSIPGWVGDVDRYQRVVVHAWDPNGREQWIRAEDFFARCMQHEVDHLNGILYKDRALRMVRQRSEDDEQAVAEREG